MEESSKERESAREKQAVKKKLSYNYGEQLPEVLAVFWASYLLYVISIVAALYHSGFEPFCGSIVIAIGGCSAMKSTLTRTTHTHSLTHTCSYVPARGANACTRAITNA